MHDAIGSRTLPYHPEDLLSQVVVDQMKAKMSNLNRQIKEKLGPSMEKDW